MKVNKELFDLSNEILETYDPGKLKAKSIRTVEDEKSKIWAAKGAAPAKDGANGPVAGHHTQLQDNKWDKISKDIDNQEKMEEAA